MALLQNLPRELLCMILYSFDSPGDFLSLIWASPSCFRLYAATPERFLTAVLEKAIQPAALPHAVASLRIRDVLRKETSPKRRHEERERPEERVKTFFICEYFPDKEDDRREVVFDRLPTDKEALLALCGLCSRVWPFLDDYSSRAMRALVATAAVDEPGAVVQGEEPGEAVVEKKKIQQPPPLSPSERARFQRAFFRFELYSRAFPPNHRASPHGSFLPAEGQFYYFLSRLVPWEAEEMSCVHEYFTSVIGEFIDDLQFEVVQAVLSAPGVHRPAGRLPGDPDPRPRSPSRSQSLLQQRRSRITADDDDDDIDEMVSFKKLNRRGLGLFSMDRRCQSDRYIGYLASLGLAFLYRLVFLSNDDRRRELIRENSPARRDFLPEAVEHVDGTPRRYFREWPDDDDDDGDDNGDVHHHNVVDDKDDPSHPNAGFRLFIRGWGPVPDDECIYGRFYVRIRHNTTTRALRLRAYVFWDSERINGQPAFVKSIRDAARVDPQRADDLPPFDGGVGRRRSAQGMLEGVRIPWLEMQKIVEVYGSTYNQLER